MHEPYHLYDHTFPASFLERLEQSVAVVQQALFASPFCHRYFAVFAKRAICDFAKTAHAERTFSNEKGALPCLKYNVAAVHVQNQEYTILFGKAATPSTFLLQKM